MSRFKKFIPIIAAICMVVIGLFISFSQRETQKEQFQNTFIDIFDTVTQFIGYADDAETFTEQTNILKEELATYHKLYDIYNKYDGINNLNTINENAGIAPVKVDQKIIDLLEFSIDLYKKTNGKINIAMGSVLQIWHNYRTHGINRPDEASLPSMEELKNAYTHCNISNIIIDKEASTVYLTDPEMSLDVGSIGKGYAVQRVADYARELGYDSLVINCGGNVATIGIKADGNKWRLGIQNPDLQSDNVMIKKVEITDKCLVTSGDYQRYYVVDGVEYCHIIDPDTLMPPTYFSAVSIITDDSGLADALSTALFNMPYEEGLALINSIENAEAIWISKDGTIQYSENFEKYIVE